MAMKSVATLMLMLILCSSLCLTPALAARSQPEASTQAVNPDWAWSGSWSSSPGGSSGSSAPGWSWSRSGSWSTPSGSGGWSWWWPWPIFFPPQGGSPPPSQGGAPSTPKPGPAPATPAPPKQGPATPLPPKQGPATPLPPKQGPATPLPPKQGPATPSPPAFQWPKPDPKAQKCWSTFGDIGKCVEEVLNKFWKRDISLGPACCAAITEVGEDCFAALFKQYNNPFLSALIKDHCKN